MRGNHFIPYGNGAWFEDLGFKAGFYSIGKCSRWHGMDYLQILLGIAAIQLLGAASPGPTFIVVWMRRISAAR